MAEAAAPLGIAPIASPLAGEKLTKKVLKLVKKAAKAKAVARGVKETTKALRSRKAGDGPALMVLAGNITPIDVITHVPILCEEAGIPYIFVPRKEDLGAASATKRPTSCVLVSAGSADEHREYFDEIVAKVVSVQISY